MENTTSSRKPTKREMFNGLLNNPTLTDAQKDFIKHEIELLEKKNSADRKPTATQITNDALKAAILETLEPGKHYTVTEIAKAVPALAGMTPQKVSPLANQLMDDGKLVKTTEKRRSYFFLPSED